MTSAVGPARILAVANQKGGVGKTTTAINLSAALAERKHTTLLVDLDPQGNATSGVGCPRDRTRRSIYHVLLGAAPVEEVIVPTSISGLDLVPSSIDLLGAEVELIPVPQRERLLSAALGTVRETYRCILIDCPPSLGLLTVNALTAADSVLVPLQCEYLAMEGLSSLTETLRLVIRSLNPRLALEGILLTMFDGRNNLSHAVEKEVRQHFGAQVFEVVIPRSVRLSEAPSYGQPILRYEPDSRGAEAYRALAHVLATRHFEAEPPVDGESRSDVLSRAS